MNAISPPEEIVLERLRLRRPRITDAQAIFEYGSDPEVAHYADWRIQTNIDSLIESLRKRAAVWDAGTEFSWIITKATEDRAIGGVSCTIEVESAEIGFLLNKHYWRNGYATEASRAILEWLFSIPSVSKVVATCDSENVASRRVLEKLGFTRESTESRSIVRPQISSEPRDALLYSCTAPNPTEPCSTKPSQKK